MQRHKIGDRVRSSAAARRPATLVAILAAGAIILSGCAGAGNKTAEGDGGAKVLKATLISTQPVNDKGVMEDVVSGFEKAADKAGIKHNVVVLSDPSTYTSTLRTVAKDSDLILATFPPMIQAIQEVAPSTPDVKFVLLDARLEKELPNVQELFFRENESSYLAGIVAGKMTKTEKVGFLGALQQDVIDRYLVGFYSGAKAVNPAIDVCFAYVGSTNDPALGKQFATTMYGQGVDIIHAATAGTQVGVYQAAEQAKKFLISADVDVRPLAPNYGLTATGPDFAGAARIAIESFVSGSLKPGLQIYGLADGAVRILPFNKDLVPADVQKAVKDAEEGIISGSITVPDDRDVSKLVNCK